MKKNMRFLVRRPSQSVFLDFQEKHLKFRFSHPNMSSPSPLSRGRSRFVLFRHKIRLGGSLCLLVLIIRCQFYLQIYRRCGA